MVRDAEYLITKLGSLVGFGDTGEFLTNIVKTKEVQAEAPAAPVDGAEDSSAGAADKAEQPETKEASPGSAQETTKEAAE